MCDCGCEPLNKRFGQFLALCLRDKNRLLAEAMWPYSRAHTQTLRSIATAPKARYFALWPWARRLDGADAIGVLGQNTRKICADIMVRRHFVQRCCMG